MSLIINMLKDLEKRQNNQFIPPLVTQASSSQPFYQSIYFKIIGAVLLLMLFSATFYVTFHKKQVKAQLAIPPESKITKTDSAANNLESDIWHKPSIVQSISYETKQDATDITFALTREVLYRIIGTKDNHMITLYLDNAGMQSDLPSLTGAEDAISDIKVMSANNTIKLTITLKPGAFLKYVQQNTNGNHPELVVSLSNPPLPAAEPVAAATSNIKTPTMQSMVVEKYQSALKLAENGDKQAAIDIMTKLLKFYPDYNEVRVSLAAIYLEMGNPILSRQIIDEGLELTPTYLPLIELKARLLTSEGKTREALMILQSEQPLITEAPSYHALIAALFNRENNYELAANIYQKLVQINPHEGSWWFGLGVSMDKLGKNHDAVYAYTKAATEGRLNAQALAFLHTRLKSLEDAVNVKK